jgi:hypothetical protein
LGRPLCLLAAADDSRAWLGYRHVVKRVWLPDPGVSRFAGSTTRAPPGQQPIPAKTDQPNGLAADALNPQGYY